MIDKVAEWGFPVRKFELKLTVKDMLTKKGTYNQKKFRKAKIQYIKKKIYCQPTFTNSKSTIETPQQGVTAA